MVDFLAVRLLLDRFSLAEAARETIGFTGPLAELRASCARRRPAEQGSTVEPQAFVLFQLAQVLGWTPEELHHLGPAAWAELVGEIEAFSSVERRRVFHLAYERRFCAQTLDAVALHPRYRPTGKPRFQAVCCLDEREESFRRHLEEIAPDVETFGVAGFFGVVMYYRGVADAHFVPLCPVVVRPNHWVEEQVGDELQEEHRARTRTRRALGAAAHRFMVGTRGFALGALLATGLGVLASVPLVLRILFPRLYARFHGALGRFVRHPQHTHLKLERSAATPGAENGHLGYTVDEMADVGERTLRDIGLTDGFARLVFLIGHGSNSLNNPHKSAYDCGACGGSPGGPNARALARILNDRRVRERLARRGLTVPEDTLFVGAFHNTCDDTVALFDTERIPATHQDEFHTAERDLKHTCQRNAHERCRRFMSAPLTLSFADAWRHVEARSEDLAQTRPELGHATNALCVVGRRERTRGLFLDRRAFLTSYDPTTDDIEASVLTRILQAVFPVCSGISLEYYFSHVDSPGWGCGSKLPHNITSLLGVMDGAASDLRTGLPWQMVEIHEPVRLLIIVETTPETLLRIFERHEGLGRLVHNGWVQVASLDPESQAVWVWQDGGFHHYPPHAAALPVAQSSTDWYRGWRDHLEFAEIVP
ncbi:MAG: putative inorganic carbon transporter subunit DabA [Gemmataceae bacterium]